MSDAIETREQRHTRIVADGTVASQMMPLLERFFVQEETNINMAFRRLPPNCQLADYQAIKCYADELERLKKNITHYISAMHDEIAVRAHKQAEDTTAGSDWLPV